MSPDFWIQIPELTWDKNNLEISAHVTVSQFFFQNIINNFLAENIFMSYSNLSPVYPKVASTARPHWVLKKKRSETKGLTILRMS